MRNDNSTKFQLAQWLLLAGYFVEITIKSQIVHASVGRIKLSRFLRLFAIALVCFRFVIFDVVFLIIHFLFSAQNFSSFCRQVPIFTLRFLTTAGLGKN
jgi:hypothetical protein